MAVKEYRLNKTEGIKASQELSQVVRGLSNDIMGLGIGNLSYVAHLTKSDANVLFYNGRIPKEDSLLIIASDKNQLAQARKDINQGLKSHGLNLVGVRG